MGSNPSFYKYGDNGPVEMVSWNDIQEFILKLNSKSGKTYRLPTEAEWEYAAGGGATNRTKWAGTNIKSNLRNYAWYYENSEIRTHPVGTKNPNSLGIYDMSGNVGEWCSDYYSKYRNLPLTNPQGPATGKRRVYRGGSFLEEDFMCPSDYRHYDAPDFSLDNLGFRVVLVP